ncbi:MAG: hypothetical protein DRG34_06720, partial [Deltaproteobacteria bacterium]
MRIADLKKAENRDSPVGAAFPDLSLSKVSRDLDCGFYDFYDFYAFYGFYGLPFTVYCLPFTV